MADTSCGLVMIQQQMASESSAAEPFNVRFLSHDAHGWHDGSGIVTIGQYDDLEVAVTIAALRYGVEDQNWMPASRFAVAVLGAALLQDAPIDVSLLVKRNREQGE